MNINKLYIFLFLFVGVGIVSGCVTKKRKGDVSKLKKFYHNTTSEYNGYFNANELMTFALEDLSNANVDNYTNVISLYDYINVPDPKMVASDMDKAIEKVTRVALLHEPGDWVDDCYVLMGKAQYLKQDYQTAIETFEYFQEDFNPANPYGRNFQKKKLSAKQRNKQLQKERKEQKKEREKQREDLKKEREKVQKERKRNNSRGKSSRSRTSSNRTRTNTPKTDTVAAPQITNAPTAPATTDPKAAVNPTKNPVDKSAYNEGLLWLAKSYIRAGKPTSAEFLLNRLEKQPLNDKSLKRDMLITQADLMIQYNKNAKAIDYIDEALTYKADRDDKGRWAFVAGQLLMNDGYYKDAKTYFNLAKKKSTNYRMKFMSILNGIKCAQLQGGRSKSEVAGELNKLLKETKYEEFKDQIYFALGEINATEGDMDLAKENFSKSVSESKDPALKTEAYYRLAEITYNKEMYVDAKKYYDSTLQVMAKLDPRYKQVERFSSNLTDIAKNIETIARIDSSLAMSNLPKSELMKIAQERLKKEKDTGKATDTKVGDKNLFVNGGRPKAVISSFWAYNAVQKEMGIIDFSNKWGDRPLVDNWRVESIYKSTPNFTNGVIKDGSNDPLITDDVANDITDAEYDRLMADIPRTALEKGKLEEQLRKAQFELGKQFRDKIQNYDKSIETLENLNDRFNIHQDIAETYFYLFLDYQDLNNPSQANYYKDKLAENYSDTKFGQIANDPAYAETLLNEANKVERYYEQTYKLFENKKYEQVTERVDIAMRDFGKENKLVAKFSLLNAMALGYTQGQQAYIDALNEVIVRYPNSPEETKAREIMRLLKGDASAFSPIDVKEVDNMFTMEDNTRHYVSIILFDKSFDTMEEAKIKISEYNKTYHSTSRLNLGEFFLNQTESIQLILVRSFQNKEKAMEYYHDVMKKREEYIPTQLVNWEILPISANNHRKMLQQRTHINYRAYFEKNYLGN